MTAQGSLVTAKTPEYSPLWLLIPESCRAVWFYRQQGNQWGFGNERSILLSPLFRRKNFTFFRTQKGAESPEERMKFCPQNSDVEVQILGTFWFCRLASFYLHWNLFFEKVSEKSLFAGGRSSCRLPERHNVAWGSYMRKSNGSTELFLLVYPAHPFAAPWVRPIPADDKTNHKYILLLRG